MANYGLKLKGDIRTDDDFYSQLQLLRPSVTESDTNLTIASSKFTKGDGQVVRAYINNKTPSNYTGSTVNLASFTGLIPTGNFVKALITINASDVISVLLGVPSAVSDAAATEPSTTDYPIALLHLQVVAGVPLTILNNALEDRRPINQNGGSSIIPEHFDMMSEQFLAQLSESFIAPPSDANNSINFSANMTQLAQYQSASGGNLMTLSYSTVTGTVTTGTVLTLAATPSFTVTPNCWVLQGGVYRRITAVTDQTNMTLASPGLSNTTGNVTLLQPVYTLDLYNNVGNAGDQTRIVDTFGGTNSVDDVVVDYDDSTGSGNLVYAGGTPNVVCLGSTSNIDTYQVILRPTSKDGLISDVVLSPTAQNLVLTFLPNATTGSGSVNLLGYTCLFLKDQDVYRGGVFNTAYGFTDNSGSNLNCTFGTGTNSVSLTTATTINLNGNFQSYVPGVNTGTTYGDITVLDSGIEIPRYVAGVTDATLPYYTETSPNKITLWGLFNSVSTRRQISVVRRFGTIDTSDANATFIANLQSNSFLLANAIVGSALQVSQGLAGFTSIAAAYASLAGNPGKILVLPGTYTENPSFSTAVTVVGFGITTIINGTVTLAAGADHSSLSALQILDNVTINANACFVSNVWLATGKSITNSGTANSITYIIE